MSSREAAARCESWCHPGLVNGAGRALRFGTSLPRQRCAYSRGQRRANFIISLTEFALSHTSPLCPRSLSAEPWVLAVARCPRLFLYLLQYWDSPFHAL